MPTQSFRAYRPGSGKESNAGKQRLAAAILQQEANNSCAYWQKIGLPPRGARLHNAITVGLPYSIYKKIAKLLAIDERALALIVSIPLATFQRRVKGGRFSREESDRLFRLAELYNAALGLFEGDSDGARRWIQETVRGLGGRRPVDMVNTSVEAWAAMELIGRLEYGIAV